MTRRAGFSFASFLALASAALVAGGPLAQQMPVSRCEGKDGVVTYSNRECPAGTAPVRKVNTAPPVSVPEEKAAKERAKRDAADVKQIDKERKQQADEEKRVADKRLQADEKAEVKLAGRCERARRELARAVQARNALDTKAATVEQMQKASQEVAKLDSELPNACPK